MINPVSPPRASAFSILADSLIELLIVEMEQSRQHSRLAHVGQPHSDSVPDSQKALDFVQKQSVHPK